MVSLLVFDEVFDVQNASLTVHGKSQDKPLVLELDYVSSEMPAEEEVTVVNALMPIEWLIWCKCHDTVFGAGID